MRHISQVIVDLDWLKTLASRVRRLEPDHRDPEKYFIEKDEIVRELITGGKEPAE